MTLSRAELTAVLTRRGLVARRSLGQNFVVDPDTVRRIVECAGVRPEDAVVEVGPGPGSLTLALVEAGARVVAVERDPAMVAVLEEVTATVEPKPSVVLADATDLDWAAVLGSAPVTPPAGRGWSLVANLPYNVAVPIVLHVLRDAPMIDSLVVMVQKEVADRLSAVPGGRAIGVPTVKVGWYATVERVMQVSREVFVPVPRVDSTVVRITRHRPVADEATAEVAFSLLEQAYHQRRKMLRSSLGPSVPPDVLLEAGIEPTARPEELSPTDWARLATTVVGSSR
jgi:16S rRNA (adenine1518-N6/adenine1519-N6)-dimethyltransferase